MKVVFLILLFLSFTVKAEDLGQASLDSFKVSRVEILQSLEQMKKDGKISDADYIKAKKELGEMDQNKIDGMNKKAKDMIKASPTDAEKMYQDFDKVLK